MDDRRWLDDTALACAKAAMWGMPVWPILPPQARKRAQRRSVRPNRPSLIAPFGLRRTALPPLTRRIGPRGTFPGAPSSAAGSPPDLAPVLLTTKPPEARSQIRDHVWPEEYGE
jgi:hypothetical protein